MPYLGPVKPTETTSSVLRSTHTGDGATTTFNLPGPVANETSIIATINGVTQQDAAYTTNGSQIIFSAAPANGDAIELRTISDVGMSYAPSTGSVTTGILADGAVTAGKLADTLDLTGKTVSLAPGGVGYGKVLQVVQGTISSEVATNSGTSTTTGLSASITPSSASSKILVLSSLPTRIDTGATTLGEISLRRGATILAAKSIFASSEMKTSFDFSFLDSPNTTSSQQYSIFIAVGVTNNANIRISTDNRLSTIILMEIAA